MQVASVVVASCQLWLQILVSKSSTISCIFMIMLHCVCVCISDPLLVFQGCHNKVPQIIGGLKHGNVLFMVLEARSPRSRCWQGHALSENL